jgi:hypothetical protein
MKIYISEEQLKNLIKRIILNERKEISKNKEK